MIFQAQPKTPTSTPVPTTSTQQAQAANVPLPVGAKRIHIAVKDALIEMIRLNHDMKRHKHTPAATEEIELYSLKVWKTHVAGEKRIRQLKEEIASLEREDKKIWSTFQGLIGPAMLTSESMIPVYEELCHIYSQLEGMALKNLSSPDYAAHLVSIQKKLHDLEENRVSTMNIIVPPESSDIPSGQAIISTLLNRCYKLAHTLACEEPAIEPPSRLLEINDSLFSLLTALETGYTFDPILLRLLAEELHEIEVSKINGNYVEMDGSIALNQVTIKRDIDMAHEFINEILIHMDPTTAMLPSTLHRDDKKLHKLYRDVKTARDEMKLHIDDGGAGASFDFLPVMQPIQDALVYLEHGVETTVGGARVLLSNALQSALTYAARLADSLSPVDPSLRALYDRMQAVHDRLQAMRNAQNWEKIVSHGHSYPNFEKELEECDAELQSIRKWKSAGLWMDEQGISNDDDIYSQDMCDLAFNRANHLLQDLLFQKNLKV